MLLKYNVRIVHYFQEHRRRIGVMALSVTTQQHEIINDALRCHLSPFSLADTALWHPAPAPLRPSSPSSSPPPPPIFGWLLCLPSAAVRAGCFWLSIVSTQIAMVNCWVIPLPCLIQTAPVIGGVANDPFNESIDTLFVKCEEVGNWWAVFDATLTPTEFAAGTNCWLIIVWVPDCCNGTSVCLFIPCVVWSFIRSLVGLQIGSRLGSFVGLLVG